MRGTLTRISAIVLATALSASTAQAQSGVQFGLGGGASIPLGDFSDGFGTGYHGLVLLGFQGSAGSPIGFRVDGAFQRNGFDTADLDFQVISGTGNVVYSFKTSDDTVFRPYLIGGGGVYNVRATGDDDTDVFEGDSQTKFGINAGAGFNFALGSLGLFAEGRFHNVFSGLGAGDGDGSSLNFIPITVGIRFGSAGG